MVVAVGGIVNPESSLALAVGVAKSQAFSESGHNSAGSLLPEDRVLVWEALTPQLTVYSQPQDPPARTFLPLSDGQVAAALGGVVVVPAEVAALVVVGAELPHPLLGTVVVVVGAAEVPHPLWGTVVVVLTVTKVVLVVLETQSLQVGSTQASVVVVLTAGLVVVLVVAGATGLVVEELSQSAQVVAAATGSQIGAPV